MKCTAWARVALRSDASLHAHLTPVERLTLHPASLESYPSMFHIFSKHEFDECYHLAAQSFVAESFADGFSTMNININGTHYLLAARRELRPDCRFDVAGTSEMFGNVAEKPQTEKTPFHPRSPYGISKGRRLSVDPKLSRSLRNVLRQRDSLQSRRSAPRL
jgi:GDPmannose 4,6-dehydratase